MVCQMICLQVNHFLVCQESSRKHCWRRSYFQRSQGSRISARGLKIDSNKNIFYPTFKRKVYLSKQNRHVPYKGGATSGGKAMRPDAWPGERKNMPKGITEGQKLYPGDKVAIDRPSYKSKLTGPWFSGNLYFCIEVRLKGTT